MHVACEKLKRTFGSRKEFKWFLGKLFKLPDNNTPVVLGDLPLIGSVLFHDVYLF